MTLLKKMILFGCNYVMLHTICNNGKSPIISYYKPLKQSVSAFVKNQELWCFSYLVYFFLALPVYQKWFFRKYISTFFERMILQTVVEAINITFFYHPIFLEITFLLWTLLLLRFLIMTYIRILIKVSY